MRDLVVFFLSEGNQCLAWRVYYIQEANIFALIIVILKWCWQPIYQLQRNTIFSLLLLVARSSLLFWLSGYISLEFCVFGYVYTLSSLSFLSVLFLSDRAKNKNSQIYLSKKQRKNSLKKEKRKLTMKDVENTQNDVHAYGNFKPSHLTNWKKCA